MTAAKRVRAVILDDGTLVAVASDRPDTLDVVPGVPSPEADPATSPVVRQFPLGAVWQMQAGFRWSFDDEQVREVAPKHLLAHGLTGDRTVVRVAVRGTPRVTVELTEPAPTRTTTVIAATDSSGFPPFTAVFSGQVDQVIALSIEAALAGASDRITVAYHAEVAAGMPIDADIIDQAVHHGITYTKASDRPGVYTVTARADLARWIPQPTIEKGTRTC
jgi:hypothetical protein